jgi:hypothetical protein
LFTYLKHNSTSEPEWALFWAKIHDNVIIGAFFNCHNCHKIDIWRLESKCPGDPGTGGGSYTLDDRFLVVRIYEPFSPVERRGTPSLQLSDNVLIVEWPEFQSTCFYNLTNLETSPEIMEPNWTGGFDVRFQVVSQQLWKKQKRKKMASLQKSYQITGFLG